MSASRNRHVPTYVLQYTLVVALKSNIRVTIKQCSILTPNLLTKLKGTHFQKHILYGKLFSKNCIFTRKPLIVYTVGKIYGRATFISTLNLRNCLSHSHVGAPVLLHVSSVLFLTHIDPLILYDLLHRSLDCCNKSIGGVFMPFGQSGFVLISTYQSARE